jgi:hypothetical protein
MSPLTLFGVLAVSAMLVFYALEDRSRSFVLLFAAACAASSLYGFLQGAWPFGVVEAIWTGVAVRRWQQRPGLQSNPESRPIACDMTALSRDERQRYDLLRSRVLGAIESVTPTVQSFQLRLGSAVTAQDVVEWMALKHQCCPFLTTAITIRPDGTRWVELGGSAAIKDFLREEFSTVLR